MDAAVNPLLIDWDELGALPPFELIRPAHFGPAFSQATASHRAELARITEQPEPADFDNTLAAFDRAGAALHRVASVFHNLAASATSPALQAVQREQAAPLAAHQSAVYQDEALFARIEAVYFQREQLGLTPEQRRLAERLHADFVRSGARLTGAERDDYAGLMQRLATLTTAFAQNVLHDEADYVLPLPTAAEQAGLPEFVLAAARQAATDRGLTDAPVITLSRSLIVPFLSYSTRRDLREQAWRAWVGRGEHAGQHDNRPIVRQILALRARQAALLGHANYADYNLADTMAQRRERVWSLLDDVWQRALPALANERAMLAQAMADAKLPADNTTDTATDTTIEPWDWRFWAEKVRVARYALDDAEVKPYFPLPAMVAAAFDCAQRLFGLRFVQRDDLPAYHPDVTVYEVREADGALVGHFLHDNFSRPTKRSGAWMSSLRLQHGNGGTSLPVVLNNNNFAKGAPGQPNLLSPDDVRTLFHEFGHGLHGMLSKVGYQRLSGTSVLRDFVELPSQLFEHWADDPGVMRRFAKHWQTGQAIPEAMVERIAAARKFGQAYETLRYCASAIVDMAAHESAVAIDDPVAFEQAVLAARGLPDGVGLNHRLVHFQHLFSGSGYAAGYYVYLWAEVLDADAFDAFNEVGDPFDPRLASQLRRWIYSSGDSIEPGQAYRNFRGRDPQIMPMLHGRGLVPD